MIFANRIQATSGGDLKCDFCRCASVQKLWLLKSDFKVSFVSVTTQQRTTCQIESDRSAERLSMIHVDTMYTNLLSRCRPTQHLNLTTTPNTPTIPVFLCFFPAEKGELIDTPTTAPHVDRLEMSGHMI